MTFKGINSWYDFEASLLEVGKKAKGDAFEQLTYWFFRLNDVHASQYDETWLWEDVPERIKSSLNLPNQDLGIDLLLQKGNEYHAVQCKYHSNRHASVTFREVATFLSVLESNNRITMGYICSSANGFSANLRKVSQNTKQVQRVLSDTWSRLDQSFFDHIRLEQQGQTRILEPFKPRAHQRKAIQKAVKHFQIDERRRGKLIFPCGAGKSLTGYWIAQALNSKKTLVAVPSLSLVKQTIEVYLRESVANKRLVKWICICSDDGIGRGDDVLMYHNDLGIPCETDVGQISNWLEANANENIIVFTTYQSGRVIAEAAQLCGVDFELGIFDEAHKTVGSKNKLFSHLLFDSNITIARRIFMTATERFYSGSKDVIISMDDVTVYGETFAQMTFKEAIEQELLTDYKVITIEVQEAEVADFIRQNNLIELDSRWGKETEARSLASMLALRKAMKRFPIRNAVSFHGSIEKAKRCAELQTYITDSYGYAQIDSYTVSGKIPTTKRNDIVQEFAHSERGLITNARCLTEGVDVPNIDCIVFADPRRSKVDIVQALGRALRKKKGKDWGYVVLPVIYNEQSGELDNDNFAEILAVVRSLASNDERIVEYLSDTRHEGKKKLDGRHHPQFSILNYSGEVSGLMDKIEIRLWDTLSKRVWLPYLKARNYSRSLGLETNRQWRSHTKLDEFPYNIPTKPDRYYKNDWRGWGDWLGYEERGGKHKHLLSYDDAKNLVKTLKITNNKEWRLYTRSTEFPWDKLPKAPSLYYADKGWVNWGDFFGTGFISSTKRKYKSYYEAKEFVQKLGLRSMSEYRMYCKGELEHLPPKPDDIPVAAPSIYKREWEGWKAFLGYRNTKRKESRFVPYDKAQELIEPLNIKSNKHWRQAVRLGLLPKGVPRSPDRFYAKSGEWKSWGAFLMTNNFYSFEKTETAFDRIREFVRPLDLATWTDWKCYCKNGDKPKWIPTRVNEVYKDFWVSWPHFLGTED